MADSQLEKAGDSSAAEAEAPVPAPAAPEPVDERYSAFTANEKRCIVGLVSYAAWFSTLSSFAYYPALPALSSALGVSTGAINLTVTTYMAVATVAPSLVGDAADVLGRRAMYLVTLGIYVVANAAIALSRSYAALLGLRVLQAAAISGTFSIAYGVIADVASPAERGSYAAAVSFAITIAPSVGPILGGGLTFVAGWTWIFWFLCIASGVCLALMVFFLPETSRNLVGNGTVQPPKYLQLPFPQVMRHWKDSSMAARHRRVPNPLNSLIILARKDNTVVILACGFLYVIFTCINASLSTLFVSIYSLNQWEAGLIYLPFGLGGVASSFFSGRLMDEAYRHSKVAQGLSVDRAVGDDLDSFSVEKARLCVIWIPMLITTGSVVSFGWVLHYRQHIAIPLALQFVSGLCMQLDFSIYNTLLVEKNHRAPAAAQASSNIVRCTLAAVAVSFLQNMIDAISIGGTFTLMGGMCLLATGLFALDYHRGMLWRQKHVCDEKRRYQIG